MSYGYTRWQLFLIVEACSSSSLLWTLFVYQLPCKSAKITAICPSKRSLSSPAISSTAVPEQLLDRRGASPTYGLTVTGFLLQQTWLSSKAHTKQKNHILHETICDRCLYAVSDHCLTQNGPRPSFVRCQSTVGDRRLFQFNPRSATVVWSLSIDVLQLHKP